MARIVSPPSDQSEWPCRSPRRCAAQRFTRVGTRLLDSVEQLLEIRGRVARERLGDHRGGRVADARELLEPTGVGEKAQLGFGHGRDLACGALEGLDAITGSSAPLEQLGYSLEGLDGGHSSTVAWRAVGFYNDQILPRVTNVMLGNAEFAKVREEVCAGLSGDVIELGFGSGLNLPFLPAEVTGLWAVDPSGTAMKLAEKRIAASPVKVHSAGLEGEHIEADDATFDAALSTMTLCTIPDVEGALTELRRVLKPGALFHFAEHGLSPDAKIARRQDRYNGLENRFAGGCNFNRDIASLLTKGGFETESIRNFYLKGPKCAGYMYVGRAPGLRRMIGARILGRLRRADRVAEGARLLSE